MPSEPSSYPSNLSSSEDFPAKSKNDFGQDPGSVEGITQKTVEEIKATASEASTALKEKASDIARQQKGGVADRIGSYSSAIHRRAESMEAEDPNIAWLTHRVADRLSSAADYMRTRDLQDLTTDVENFARKHPAAFFGGLFVTGLVVGNLVKATAKSTGSEGTSRPNSIPTADTPDLDPWPTGASGDVK
jgi:hypothetical protein